VNNNIILTRTLVQKFYNTIRSVLIQLLNNPIIKFKNQIKIAIEHVIMKIITKHERKEEEKLYLIIYYLL